MRLKTKVKIDSNSIEKAIEQRGRKILSAAAQKISKDMYDEAVSAIEDFYNGYSPRYYKRTLQFKNNAFRRYFLNSHATKYHGGVQLTPELMSGYVSLNGEDVTSLVYSLVVYSGKHGMAENFGAPPSPTTVPPLITRLYMKQDEIVNNIDSYLAYGISVSGM